ncbi:MAG TPA: GIY-YIG nuclease family protein [Pseudomonadales bacterium]
MTEAVATREARGENRWQVYIVQTAAGLLYTGISTDPVRRLREHESGRKGARALRGKGPLQVVYVMPAASRSEASILEARIKRLDRAQKLRIISGELILAVDTGG